MRGSCSPSRGLRNPLHCRTWEAGATCPNLWAQPQPWKSLPLSPVPSLTFSRQQVGGPLQLDYSTRNYGDSPAFVCDSVWAAASWAISMWGSWDWSPQAGQWFSLGPASGAAGGRWSSADLGAGPLGQIPEQLSAWPRGPACLMGPPGSRGTRTPASWQVPLPSCPFQLALRLADSGHTLEQEPLFPCSDPPGPRHLLQREPRLCPDPEGQIGRAHV